MSIQPIYNCIYAQPVGELKRALIAYLRQAHNKRAPRSKGQDCGGQVPDMLSATFARLRSKTGSFRGTDLFICSQEQLDAMADEVNNQPRKGLGRTITFGGLQGVPVEFAPVLPEITPLHGRLDLLKSLNR